MAHNQHLDAEDALDDAVAAGEPVFVYGTLKRGHSNHHWLAGARFVGERQLGGVQLFDLGPFPMAVAVAAAAPAGTGGTDPQEPEDTTSARPASAAPSTAAGGAATPIHGELYRVSADGLDQLDLLEGCPRLYGRHWLPLLDGSHAWVYLGRPQQVRHARLLADGLWRGRAGMPP